MPHRPIICPRCASAHVTPGTFPGERGRAYAFRPAGLRFWTFRSKAVRLPYSGFGEPNAWGCLDCGLVWSEVDRAKLREVIELAGTEDTRTRHAEALASEPPAIKR